MKLTTAVLIALSTVCVLASAKDANSAKSHYGADSCAIDKSTESDTPDYHHAGNVLLSNGEYESALEHFKMPSAHGDIDAQNSHGMMYHHGHGIHRNYSESIKWIRHSAQHGNSAAMNRLGFAYERGEGVRKSAKKAFEWTWKAAHTENADYNALIHLGSLYQYGVGTPRSVSRAASLYEIAARGGSFIAMNHLVSMYRNNNDQERLDQAIEMFKHEAVAGSRDFQDFLGSMYMYGQSVEVDSLEAIKWFSLAAEQNSAYAQSNLGAIYLQGIGVPKDLEKARSYLLLAAAQSDIDARYNLGVVYRDGLGVEINERLALAYFMKGAESEDAQSMLNAGLLFLKMNHDGLAMEYLLEAIGSPHLSNTDRNEGLLALAHMFKDGKGANRNDFLAYALAEFVGGDEGVALKEALLPGMSSKEISFAKHLTIGFWHHGNIAEILEIYQTQIESQSS